MSFLGHFPVVIFWWSFLVSNLFIVISRRHLMWSFLESHSVIRLSLVIDGLQVSMSKSTLSKAYSLRCALKPFVSSFFNVLLQPRGWQNGIRDVHHHGNRRPVHAHAREPGRPVPILVLRRAGAQRGRDPCPVERDAVLHLCRVGLYDR